MIDKVIVVYYALGCGYSPAKAQIKLWIVFPMKNPITDPSTTPSILPSR